MGTLGLLTDLEPKPSSLRRGVGLDVAGGAVAIGDVIANKYKVERLLGMGGMGCVVAARHEPLGHEVAIKVMVPELCKSDEAVARFLREARAAATLLGDHVVRVLDVDTLPSGAPFMVMELLEGHDLARELDAGPLPVRDTVDYLLQACEALAEAHALGIVHRDLKPANLFRARRADGSVVIKVLDFGVSNMVPTGAESASAVRLTDTKSLLGSPSYMSPEQVRDPKTVDPRSDIWSLGVIVHELLTGTTPFGSDSTLSVLAGVVADDPPDIRSLRADVPSGLQDVILKCLEKRARSRYATVVELAEALAVYTPTGEAAVARISAVHASATARREAGHRRGSQPPALSPVARSFSTPDVPTLASARGEISVRRPRPGIVAAAMIAAGLVVVLAVRARITARPAPSREPSLSASATATESVAASRAPLPTAPPSVAMPAAVCEPEESVRTANVARVSPSFTSTGSRKESTVRHAEATEAVGRAASPPGPAGVETAPDPLEGRE